MLDVVEPEVLAPLLGEALDFQVVDRVGLTDFEIETQTTGSRGPEAEPPQKREQPVEFVRVLLPRGERARPTVNGWPAWFTRPVGKGKVVFATLGPRGLFRDRVRSDPLRRINDPESPYKDSPDFPVPLAPLEGIANEMQPGRESFRAKAFEPALV